jgi:creatinine amidohydrolase
MTLRWWDRLKATDFPLAGGLAVLPLAAVEQHGPHLPLGTDALIMDGMLAEVARLCPEGLDLVVLPVQRIGKSDEHQWAPGTLTLTAQTALAAWVEVGLSAARAGCERLLVVNSHGGNLDLMAILARELRIRAGMLAVRCQWTGFGLPDGLFSPREAAFGIHGGDYETSLMLHFHPGLVDMGAARDFASRAEDLPISPVGPIAWGWIARDLNPAGVVGEAHLATADKGRRVAAHQAAGFLGLAARAMAMPWPPPGG